jgi:hypothetical protein
MPGVSGKTVLATAEGHNRQADRRTGSGTPFGRSPWSPDCGFRHQRAVRWYNSRRQQDRQVPLEYLDG